MIVVGVVGFFKATLTSKSDHVVLNRQIKLFLFHSGQFRLEDDLVFVFVDVDARTPRTTADAFVAERTGKIGRKQPIDLFLKRPEVSERVVSDNTHALSPPIFLGNSFYCLSWYPA